MTSQGAVTHLALHALEFPNVRCSEITESSRLTVGGGVATHAFWIFGFFPLDERKPGSSVTRQSPSREFAGMAVDAGTRRSVTAGVGFGLSGVLGRLEASVLFIPHQTV